MSKDLFNKGVVDAKSLILKFPTEEQVPKHLIHHFIRGYFDGDGCIASKITKKDKNEQYTFSVAGSLNFLNICQDILVKEIGLNKNKIVKNRTIFNLSYGGNLQVMKIHNYLYKECNDLVLLRKKEKFEKLISDYKNKLNK